jgi:hypothetical protein
MNTKNTDRQVKIIIAIVIFIDYFTLLFGTAYIGALGRFGSDNIVIAAIGSVIVAVVLFRVAWNEFWRIWNEIKAGEGQKSICYFWVLMIIWSCVLTLVYVNLREPPHIIWLIGPLVVVWSTSLYIWYIWHKENLIMKK